MHYLTLPELLNLTKRLGADEVRDYGLLDSALARPQSSVFGQDAYPDVWEKAAALMESLARNHALVDGNKRIAWYAAWVFLHMNGHPWTRSSTWTRPRRSSSTSVRAPWTCRKPPPDCHASHADP